MAGAETSTLPVIAIAREYGAGATEIAAILAQRLDATLVDRSLIDEVARRVSLSPEEVEAEDEQPRTLVDRVLRAVAPMNQAAGVVWEPPVLDPIPDPHDSIVTQTAQVIREVARSGNAVIVGRAAGFVLADDRSVISVMLCAPVEARVPRIAKRLGVDDVHARRIIQDTDAHRGTYVRQVHGHDWQDPVHYDLVLNTGRVSYDQAVELILAFAHARAG